MPRIIIMNAGIEHTMGATAPHDWLVRSALRHAWFANEGDVYVSPVEISDDELSYVAQVLDLDRSSINVVDCQAVITDENLRSSALQDMLREQVSGMQGWSIFPCFYSAGVADMVRRLDLADPGGLQFASERGLDLLNRKSHFRRLMAGAGLPLAEGTVAETPRRLAGALATLMNRTGTVIVKRDDGAGSLGNVTVTAEAAAIPLPGASKALGAESDVPGLAERLWAEMTDEWSPVLVVEAYYPTTHRFYSEFCIGDGGQPALLHTGTIRSEHDPAKTSESPRKVGLELPAGLPVHTGAQAAAMSTQVAMLAGLVGYRGIVNIDAVATVDGRVLFNEINARWGGGTVLHAIADRLLGEGWADSHAVSSLRALPARDAAGLIEDLHRCDLHFNRGSNEGVVVLACDDCRSSTMECMVIGDSRSRVRHLEDELLRMLRVILVPGHGESVSEVGTRVTSRQWKLLPGDEDRRTQSDR